jgi:two-component system, NarL family, sensor kinase
MLRRTVQRVQQRQQPRSAAFRHEFIPPCVVRLRRSPANRVDWTGKRRHRTLVEQAIARRTARSGGRTRELEILAAIATGLNSAADVEHALTQTLALVAELLGLRTGWVWLLDPATQQFYSAAAQHLPPYLREPLHMTGAPCWCLQSFQKGQLTASNVEVLECSRLRAAVGGAVAETTAGLRYHASIPLFFQDQPLGVMNVAGPAWRKLTAQELRLLSIIAAHLSVAIDRARLAEASTRLARAEERAHLAREFHDTLAQGLAAITLQLEGALRHLEHDPTGARQRIQRALEVTRENLEEARRSVGNLRASLPAGMPLPVALQALCRAFTAETGVRVAVHVTGSRALPPGLEIELYRIGQEALANVRQHARATDVTVILALRPSTVTLTVRDNGQGFDAETVRPAGHGILGMRERARLLGGRLRIIGRPGRGTLVTALVPLLVETAPG